MPLDTILVVDKYPEKGTNNKVEQLHKRLGGIGNVARALDRISEGTPIGINPTSKVSLTWATIIIEKETNTRTSLVHWGDNNTVKDILVLGDSALWNHFAYVDILDPMDSEIWNLKKEGIPTSADLAGVGPANTNLDLFEYVFVSEQDFTKYDFKGTKTIVHSPGYLSLNWLDQVYHNAVNPEIVNTLGAGDILAAVFINHMLTKDSDFINLASIQHQTEQLLLEEQWLI
jgi:sugar/nucleoside kinase (ribokinase family)